MKVSVAAARTLIASALAAFAGFSAGQPAYPSKPVRFIVPFPPGASNDTLARLLGQKMTENWGQQVAVDNRGGGATIIGSEALVKSAPDGYTIMLTSNAHVINASLYPKLPYDTVKDFAPVATVASTEQFLVLHPSVPAGNLREFIALAKSKPGQLNYASSGTGNPTHLAGELFNMMTGVKMQHVPYKGGGPAINDLLGGQVQLHFNVPINLVPHIKSGRIKAIAISGDARLPAVPQVPTFTEAGLPGFDVKAWYGVFAPAATPRPIIDKVSAEIARILAMPDIKEKLITQGMSPFVSGPEQFAALIKADIARFAKVIKTANIKPEN